MVESEANSSRHLAPEGFLGMLYVAFLSVVSVALMAASFPGEVRARLTGRK